MSDNATVRNAVFKRVVLCALDGDVIYVREVREARAELYGGNAQNTASATDVYTHAVFL